ncbi:hypothetical protein ALC56_05945 [Trachymyrmex septentrionalis]|uniref:Uncharacterized protein n=1 Tax=Trachymyrmex septentrionalis TaxID=34720 RepID=A0A195FGT7_9HYME|nr:hypothetical protein ALC56_05945 [Trachymyrmex septentrionalis]
MLIIKLSWEPIYPRERKRGRGRSRKIIKRNNVKRGRKSGEPEFPCLFLSGLACQARCESFLFPRGQERIKFRTKVNSRNSSISLSTSCRRILVQLALGQKQINLTRKRGAVFTGNHAATTETKRGRGRRRSLWAKEFVANAPSVRPHPRSNRQAVGPGGPSSFEEGGIGFNGTPFLFIFLGVFWPRSNVGPRGHDYL